MDFASIFCAQTQRQMHCLAIVALPDLALARIAQLSDIVTRAKMRATCQRIKKVLHVWHIVIYAREIAAARTLQRTWLRCLFGKARPLLEHEFPETLLRAPYCVQQNINGGAHQRQLAAQQCVTALELNRFHYRAQHYCLTLAPATRWRRYFCRFRLRKVACWFRECFVALSHCAPTHMSLGQISLYVGPICVRHWHCDIDQNCRWRRIVPNCVLQSLPNRQAHLQVEIKMSAAIGHLFNGGLLRVRTKTFYVPNDRRWTELIESKLVEQVAL